MYLKTTKKEMMENIIRNFNRLMKNETDEFCPTWEN
jgi:hypothetical protein